MTLITDIRKDREVGSGGAWEWRVDTDNIRALMTGGRIAAGWIAFAHDPENTVGDADGEEDHRQEAEANMARIARVPEMEAALLAADELAQAIEDLISESDGVGGLHLNGDFAPWGELTEGGRFEEWLIALATYRKATGVT
jgi:hypothetical protein